MLEFFLKTAYQLKKQDHPEMEMEDIKKEIRKKIKSETGIIVKY